MELRLSKHFSLSQTYPAHAMSEYSDSIRECPQCEILFPMRKQDLWLIRRKEILDSSEAELSLNPMSRYLGSRRHGSRK